MMNSRGNAWGTPSPHSIADGRQGCEAEGRLGRAAAGGCRAAGSMAVGRPPGTGGAGRVFSGRYPTLGGGRDEARYRPVRTLGRFDRTLRSGPSMRRANVVEGWKADSRCLPASGRNQQKTFEAAPPTRVGLAHVCLLLILLATAGIVSGTGVLTTTRP